MHMDPTPNPMKLIGRAAKGFSRIADAELRHFGFATGQLPVLVALKGGKALSQAELTRIARVEQSSMAQLLNRMERDGIVQRLPDPADRRSRLISLRPEAARRLPKAKARMDALAAGVLAALAPQDVATLTALLQQITERLDRLVDDGAAS